jgi:hypothetical protein
MELELRVVDENGYSDTSTVLLAESDTTVWNSGGDDRNFLLVRQYFQILDSLENAVVRAASSPKGSINSYQSKQKINVKKAEGYIALSDFGSFGESGGEILSAAQQTIDGQMRVDLKYRVVDDANYGLSSGQLLTVADSTAFAAGGAERDRLILRTYLNMLNSLQASVARSTTRSHVVKINTKQAQGFMSLANLNKFKDDTRAQITAMDQQITSISAEITAVGVRLAVLDGVRSATSDRATFDAAQSERSDLFTKRSELERKRIALENERNRLRNLIPFQ